MANRLRDVMPKILAQALGTLRESAVMPMLVNTDYSPEAAQKGGVVHIPVPQQMEAHDVTPGAYSTGADEISMPTVPLVLNQWKEAAFYLTDREITEVASGVPNIQIQEAARALANTVDKALLNLYRQVPAAVGTAGTTPFGTNLNDAVEARKILNKNLCPQSDRRIVLDVEAEANVIELIAARDDSRSDQMEFVEGYVGRKLGFDWFMDQNNPYHTAGTIAPKTSVGSPITIGVAPTVVETEDPSGLGLYDSIKINRVTLAAANENTTIAIGDLFRIAGDPNTYSVTSSATVPDNVGAGTTNSVAISFSPAPATAWQVGAAVTFIDSHNVSMAFHRNSFGLIIRPLANDPDLNQELGGSLVETMVDSVTGLPLRLSISREHKRLRWSLDLLFGVGAIRKQHAVRILG